MFSQYTEFRLPNTNQLGHALIAILPSPDERQPGLIACSRDGFIRYWENISFGPDHFKKGQIPLGSEDIIIHLTLMDVMPQV